MNPFSTVRQKYLPAVDIYGKVEAATGVAFLFSSQARAEAAQGKETTRND